MPREERRSLGDELVVFWRVLLWQPVKAGANEFASHVEAKHPLLSITSALEALAPFCRCARRLFRRSLFRPGLCNTCESGMRVRLVAPVCAKMCLWSCVLVRGWHRNGTRVRERTNEQSCCVIKRNAQVPRSSFCNANDGARLARCSAECVTSLLRALGSAYEKRRERLKL